MSKQVNYVIVVDFDPNYEYLDNQKLLGWDCKTDWFDCDTYGDEILTPKNRIKRTGYCWIEVSKWVGVYVGRTVDDIKLYSDNGNKEGYNCTICKLEKNADNDWIVVPV